jgi:transcriptional regulator of PTS gene
VVEGPPQNRGSQGRPELQLLPNFTRLLAVAVRVVSRNLVASLIDFGDNVVTEEARPMPDAVNDAEALSTILDIVASMRQRAPRGSEVIGVGLSLPGIVNAKQGRWVNSGRWANIRELDTATLERELGIPVHMYGMQAAELRYLLERRPELQEGGTLLFHWGYGIGASYAFDGEVMSSTLGSFAEVGHVRMFPDSRKRCMCGDFGCLETEAALWSLLPAIRERFPEVPEEETEFAGFYRDIEPLSLPGMAAALDSVGLALENLYRILFPDRVLVFGPFTQQNEVAERLARRFRRDLPHYAPSDVSFEVLTNAFEGGEACGSTLSLFTDALRSRLTVRS